MILFSENLISFRIACQDENNLLSNNRLTLNLWNNLTSNLIVNMRLEKVKKQKK